MKTVKEGEVTSPFWCCYLSTRASNALLSEFRRGRDKNYWGARLHAHINIDFDEHTDETIRVLFKDLLEKKLIFPKRIRNFGKKSAQEFYRWCNYDK